MMKNILFYKYVDIDDIEQFREEHQSLMQSCNLKGKVLVATEGINGCVSGHGDDVERYKSALREDARFSDVEFKERDVAGHTFRKTICRIRPEIITFKQNVTPAGKKNYIEPEDLQELYESGEEFYIIDTRNKYESDVGQFKNALTPNIDIFSSYPDVLHEFEHLKKKQVVVYCTGGIRCEKASQLMLDRGFTNVRQLHGGIIRYGDVVGSSHWKGKCFVFDERVVVDVDPNNVQKAITTCSYCDNAVALYYNCANVDCDIRFICCDICVEKNKKCCNKCYNFL